MSAVRLGNVLGSSGSVAPVFEEQARRGLPLTVTHPDATRFFLTLEEVQAAILEASASGLSGKILVPDCGEAFRIVDLARFIAEDADAHIEFVGLRAGDKLYEELIADDEQVEAEDAGMRVVASHAPTVEAVASAIARLEEAIAQFDQTAMFGVLTDLVPGYKPSSELLSAERPLEVNR
jgi:FlaA1/EpsC-like NDP-sugar epimerase